MSDNRQEWSSQSATTNSNRTFHRIMRNQMNALFSLPACTPRKRIYFGPLCSVRFVMVSFLGYQSQAGHVIGPTDYLNALIDTFHLKAAHISSGISQSDNWFQLSSFCTFLGAAVSHLFSHFYFCFTFFLI